MIRKLMVVVGVIIATSCFALEMHNATILDHKSWVTGGDEKGNAISGHIDRKQSPLSASTSASTYNVSGLVNTNIYTNGYHSYRIENTSSQSKIYTVDITLCANSTYCFHDQTHINVNKNGYFYDSANSNLTCSFNYAGNYSLEAKTDVSGESSSHARDTATISVRK